MHVGHLRSRRLSRLSMHSRQNVCPQLVMHTSFTLRGQSGHLSFERRRLISSCSMLSPVPPLSSRSCNCAADARAGTGCARARAPRAERVSGVEGVGGRGGGDKLRAQRRRGRRSRARQRAARTRCSLRRASAVASAPRSARSRHSRVLACASASWDALRSLACARVRRGRERAGSGPHEKRAGEHEPRHAARAGRAAARARRRPRALAPRCDARRPLGETRWAHTRANRRSSRAAARLRGPLPPPRRAQASRAAPWWPRRSPPSACRGALRASCTPPCASPARR